MTPFQEISVYPAYPKRVFVQWLLKDTSLIGTHRFWVDRAGSPEGPWEALTTTPLLDRYFFEDTTVQLVVKENRYFYRVRYKDPRGRDFTSPAHDLLRNLRAHDFLIAQEINRKEQLRFNSKVGIKAFVLKRKHYGEVCADCVDPETGKVVKAKCKCCYGTMFKGGFYPPIETCLEVEAFPNSHVLEPGGQATSENFVSRGRMQVYPHAVRGDLIVERENNRRWEILQIYRPELRTIPVVQELQEIRLIAPTDIEYYVPVGEPLEMVELEPGV